MTPTSDERRMVAARLRKAAKEHLYSSSGLGESIAAEANCYGYPREKVFAHLADLIDPTCKVSSVETYDDELGQLEGWEFHMTCGHSFQQPWNEPPAYCPECGARVVDEDGD